MTQNDKELLLKDLSARLPYGVIVQPAGSATPHKVIGYDKGLIRVDIDVRYDLETVRPYLRPMSSMTEEETVEFKWLNDECDTMSTFNYISIEHYRLFDWLNRNHFDYRGLIEKGLAIEAPEGMYKK